MSESSIITSQYVRITHTTAGFGERLLARLIDWVIIGIYIFGWFKLSHTFWGEEVLLILFVVIPVLGYTLLFEVFNQGQTPGKKLMKIKVVMKDGSPATLSAYLLRWLIWPVDIMFSGGIGILSIFFTRNRQRLGDLAAGTLVIKLDNYKQVSVKLEEFSYLKDNYTPAFPEVSELSMEQIGVIERVLTAPAGDQNYIAQLSEKVRRLLDIRPDMEDRSFLERIVKDYYYYAYVDIV